MRNVNPTQSDVFELVDACQSLAQNEYVQQFLRAHAELSARKRFIDYALRRINNAVMGYEEDKPKY